MRLSSRKSWSSKVHRGLSVNVDCRAVNGSLGIAARIQSWSCWMSMVIVVRNAGSRRAVALRDVVSCSVEKMDLKFVGFRVG